MPPDMDDTVKRSSFGDDAEAPSPVSSTPAEIVGLVEPTKCDHPNFVASCRVGRLTDTDGGPVTSYQVDVKVTCDKCGLPFRFRGDRYGSSPHHPTLSADGIELRAPIEPAHTTELLGMPLEAGRA